MVVGALFAVVCSGHGDVLVLVRADEPFIDKWFSTPVEEVRSDTHAMVSLLGEYAARTRAPRPLLSQPPATTQRGFAGHGFSPVLSVVSRSRNHSARRICLAVQGATWRLVSMRLWPGPFLKSQTPCPKRRPDGLRVSPGTKTEYTLGSAPVGSGWLDPGCHPRFLRSFPAHCNRWRPASGAISN